ncbi:hypothetical protein TH53_12905 [Pedobacter lusitanus]|uniref:mannosyl-glycoprotein endo-beta-N-acetylglucosaminidase n=1 Tax=Pedobacter lusitanus TaxID=1503925 RepID=A0A0D0GKW5_9SPHI|nr:glycosyl hydrolase family 18 protein [Pedobacter lusitanus]KIO76815.1 hypothetical protein TH53_12905 [Pedobacter lusitanus]
MKNLFNLQTTALILTAALCATGCKKLGLEGAGGGGGTTTPPASTHLLTVGYFNGVARTAAPSDKVSYSLRDIPNGVDIVNIFHRFNELSNLKRGVRQAGAAEKTLTEILEDVTYLKTKKTRVVETQFMTEIFDNYKDAAKTTKWTNTAADYDGYAKSVSDSLTKWGIDGVDLDIEPGFSVGNLTITEQEALVNAFAKYFGPSSASKKLLIIDTNVGFSTLGFTKETLAKIDYIYIQDYFGSASSTDEKIDGYIAAGYPKDKIMLIAADFEGSYSSGKTRLKAAYTNPKYIAKTGGFGSYGINFDYNNKYQFTIDMIKTLNPQGN